MKMPETGEAWRHYNMSLYTIVGVATDTETGKPLVIYTPFGWALAQLPPLYARPLEVFLQSIKNPTQSMSGPSHIPRFEYERVPGCDPDCRYIQGPKR